MISIDLKSLISKIDLCSLSTNFCSNRDTSITKNLVQSLASRLAKPVESKGFIVFSASSKRFKTCFRSAIGRSCQEIRPYYRVFNQHCPLYYITLMRPYFWRVALGGLHLTHGFAEGQLDRVVWTVPGVTSRHWGPLILANMFQPIWPQKVLLRNDLSELGVYWVLPTFSHQSSV